jgi:hypothetical protein
MINLGTSSSISIDEARNILGITAKELSDEAIGRLIYQVDILTDIVVAHVNDSKINSSVDILTNKLDTKS